MILKDFDFSECRFNPNGKTFLSSISKKIPAFGEYQEKNRKPVFRYVVSLYDKDSPLWAKEPEYFRRKILAGTLADLSAETHGGSLSGQAMEILEGRNDKVNKLIIAYLADTGDIEYSTLVVELDAYYKYMQNMLKPDMMDKAEYGVLKELSENIKARTRFLFGSGQHEELTRVKTLLYEQAEQDRQKMNMEAIAKMLSSDGDFPADWNRYGVKYEVEPLKYYQDDSQGEA